MAPHQWKQAGRLSLWHYTESERNYRGWHLTADAEAALSLAAVLRAFKESQVECYRTLVVTAPTRSVLGVPNNRGGAAAFRAATKWRLKHSPDPDTSKLWRFAEEGNVVELTVGAAGLDKLIAGVDGILRGEGDYSIGQDGNEVLWFWWWPE